MTSLKSDRFQKSHSLGLRVFPVKPREKVPQIPWTPYKDKAPTEQEIAEWDASDCNVGIICGEPSGIVVLDIDGDEAQAAIDKLNLPNTPCVRTARGKHVFYRSPPGGLRNSVRIAGLPLDIRGDGGYVVGPGSIHPSGAEYVWEVSPADVPFADFPQSLLALIDEKQRGEGQIRSIVNGLPDAGKLTGYLANAIQEAIGEVGAAIEKSRNDTLFKAGVKLANNVAGARVPWEPFAERLFDAAIAIGLTPEETKATLASCWTSGSKQPMPWMTTAMEWIYVAALDGFYHIQSRQRLTKPAFNSHYAHQTIVSGTLGSFLLQKDLISGVQDLDYRPDTTDDYIERDGLRWRNTYRPSTVVAAEGDASRFLEFVKYLVSDDDERSHLLKMMAWTIRHPGQKLRHALLMRSSLQGVGKSMLIEIWGNLVGLHNVRKTTTEEMSGNFQSYAKQNIMIVLEELNYGFGRSEYNRLKDLITSDTSVINEKGIAVREWPNYSNLVIFTNIAQPMMIEDSDRRFCYLDLDIMKRPKEYYENFAEWWSSNLSVIRGFVDAVDLSDFNPHHAPPMTEAKRRLIASSKTELAKELLIAINERDDLLGRDLVTMAEIERVIASAMRGKTQSQLRGALHEIGAINFPQQRVPRLGAGNLGGVGDRANLWAIRNVPYWQAADTAARGEEYRRIEGLLAPFEGTGIEVWHASQYEGGIEAFNKEHGRS